MGLDAHIVLSFVEEGRTAGDAEVSEEEDPLTEFVCDVLFHIILSVVSIHLSTVLTDIENLLSYRRVSANTNTYIRYNIHRYFTSPRALKTDVVVND